MSKLNDFFFVIGILGMLFGLALILIANLIGAAILVVGAFLMLMGTEPNYKAAREE